LGLRPSGALVWGQFVDQRHLRLAGEDGVDVHLLDRDAVVLDAPAGHDVQTFQQLGRLGAAMGLDDAGDHVDAVGLEPVAFGQHLVGLADARAIAEVDLQPAPLGAADHLEKAGGRGLRP